MKKMTIVTLVATLVAVTAGLAQEELVKGEDRIDVPAIGDGLCVHNLFQSGMVLQRDKPIPVWGWTAPGETVTVSFGGQTQKTTAAEDRAWKVTFTALPANTEPQQLIVRGKKVSIKSRLY